MKTVNLKLTQPQYDFYNLDCRYPAFIGGFGSGKTYMMCVRAIFDALTHPNALIGLYEPTYKLVKKILEPTLFGLLKHFGIEYDYNIQYKVVKTRSKKCGTFLFDTLERPEQIVGYELFRAHVDEIDILKTDKAQLAWRKIIGRIRQKLPGMPEQKNRASVYTTPEGFKFVYNLWKENPKNDYQLVQASTYSNPWIDKEYIQSLRDTYPEELIDAYVNGEFVNLTSGTVYRSFNRKVNCSDETAKEKDILYVGMDFNIDKMAAVIAVKRENGFHIVDEIIDGYDTASTCSLLLERYPNHKIIIYPDSSGKNRTSKGTSESDIATIHKFKFETRYKATNPLIKDRVAAVNKAWEIKKTWVNLKLAPNFVKCTEQQAYDKNGVPDKSDGLDHEVDAWGYLVSYEMPIVRPIINIPFKFL